MTGTIFIISAPSGSGKTTLTNELRRIVPNLEFSISYTTRPPRGSEHNGREYFFVSRAEFQKMIAHREFLEYAEVFGNYYGTARRFLAEAAAKGKDLLLDIDVQGARQVKQAMPAAVSIFVLPPSREVLEWRLRHRSREEGGQREEVIERRLQMAAKEIENYSHYDYIVVNDQLEQSTDELKAIVVSERLRAGRAGGVTPAGQEELERRAESVRLENARNRIRGILESFVVRQ
ncbi:MAG: guanylate kinase [Acidobacteria bacterium]|nr:guanylate kinase [Acidobacteriota bacterium]